MKSCSYIYPGTAKSNCKNPGTILPDCIYFGTYFGNMVSTYSLQWREQKGFWNDFDSDFDTYMLEKIIDSCLTFEAGVSQEGFFLCFKGCSLTPNFPLYGSIVFTRLLVDLIFPNQKFRRGGGGLTNSCGHSCIIAPGVHCVNVTIAHGIVQTCKDSSTSYMR